MAKCKSLVNVLNLVDAAKEELPVEKQFLNDLRISIEKQDEKGKRVPSKSYKPSSMHCIRNMYFQVTGAEMQTDRASSSLVGICESGTDRHERIQNAVSSMKDTGIDCEYLDVGEWVESRHKDGKLKDIEVIQKQGNETKLFNHALNISFLCDGLIRYKGELYILEIKTESANKFWCREGVDEKHYLQGTAYCVNLELDNVLFLYECRDNCDKKAFMFTPTDKMKQDLVGKIMECDDFVKLMQVPPKPKELPKGTCTYCNYSNLCKGLQV